MRGKSKGPKYLSVRSSLIEKNVPSVATFQKAAEITRKRAVKKLPAECGGCARERTHKTSKGFKLKTQTLRNENRSGL